ncbi:MAG: hypothetical protein Q9180_009520, partial [Flavoplaca navasiana]
NDYFERFSRSRSYTRCGWRIKVNRCLIRNVLNGFVLKAILTLPKKKNQFSHLQAMLLYVEDALNGSEEELKGVFYYVIINGIFEMHGDDAGCVDETWLHKLEEQPNQVDGHHFPRKGGAIR